MKKRISFSVVGAILSITAALMLITCTKDIKLSPTDSEQTTVIPSPSISNDEIGSRDNEEMPEEIAQLLTEEQIAAFWASKPTNNPANSQQRGA